MGNIPSRDELVMLHNNENFSLQEIANYYGVAIATSHRWMKKYRIRTRTRSEANSLRYGNKKPSKNELNRLYWGEGIDTVELGRRYEVSSSTVTSWIKSYKLKIRGRSDSKLPFGVQRPSKKVLIELYHKQKKSPGEIAEVYKVSAVGVLGWMRRYNIKRRNGSEVQLRLKGVKKPKKSELKTIYLENGVIEAARYYGVDPTTIVNWLDNYQITRTRQSVKKGSWKNLEFALEQACLFLTDHQEYSELPSQQSLEKKGASSLASAIRKYHYGFPVFRQRLNEYMGRPPQEERESLLERYAEGQYER